METLILYRTSYIPNAGKFRVFLTLNEDVKEYTGEIIIFFEQTDGKPLLWGIRIKRNIQELILKALTSFDDDIHDLKKEFYNADVIQIIYNQIELFLNAKDITIHRTEIELYVLTNYNLAVLIDIKNRFPQVFQKVKSLTKSKLLTHFIEIVEAYPALDFSETINFDGQNSNGAN